VGRSGGRLQNVVKKLIPGPVKRKIRNYQANRYKARLFGSIAPLVPAVKDMFDGPQSLQEFKANGEEFLKIYKEICGLQPDEKMLDVGSGIGRKTLPLTQYLNDKAVYDGIDITKAGIEWCREKITPRFPNFRFQQIDVYNKVYNPLGKYPPSKYKFPFGDESFNFVMLGSVFTHMMPTDIKNYLSEVRRVLTKGGRCLISYFLLNEESLRLIEAGESALDLKYVFDDYRTISREVPEQAIALDENLIRDIYRKLGLKIMRLDYGSWCGRANYLSYQDLILAVKE
jgi:ubiquinone/menaquinone biosynthesis C-methylase UbiE